MKNTFKIENQILKGSEGTISIKNITFDTVVGFSRLFNSISLLRKFSKLQKKESLNNFIELISLLEENDSVKVQVNDIMVQKYNIYKFKADLINATFSIRKHDKNNNLIVNVKLDAPNDIEFIKGYKSIKIKSISSCFEFAKDELIKTLKYLEDKDSFNVSDISETFNHLNINNFEFKDEKTYLCLDISADLMLELESVIQNILITNLTLERCEGTFNQDRLENNLNVSLDEYVDILKHFKEKAKAYLTDDNNNIKITRKVKYNNRYRRYNKNHRNNK